MGSIRSLPDNNDCIVSRPGERGYLVYGPYELRHPGRYRVEFRIALADAPIHDRNPLCAKIDVCTNTGQSIVTESSLLQSDLTREFAILQLEFALQEPRELEYRVFSTGHVGLVVSSTLRVTQLSSGRSLPHVRPTEGITRRWENESEFLDGYLRNVSGLIHVGASIGQEREYYNLFGINVIWIEPIREVYEILVNNIIGKPKQVAFNALLTDEEGKEYDFYIANNGGASSSILTMDKHADIFPWIEYTEQRKLVSATLRSLMLRECISCHDYQALTLDVEGAELVVLKGAGEFLGQFQYVKCEVADFTPRDGSPVTSELTAFMQESGFHELVRRPFGDHPTAGTCWDIVWKRKTCEPLHCPGVPLPLIVPARDVAGLDKID
jgi:FkbM family methyltransferase